MPFHVYMFQYNSGLSGTGRANLFRNIPDDLLGPRIIERWDRGENVTWDGRTSESTRSSIRIFRTEESVEHDADYQAIAEAGTDVTNEWITGPAGVNAASTGSVAAAQPESPLRDHSRVMVVHGRNERTRDAMFQFLRALGLDPIEWEQAVGETGMGSPHNFDAARAAMEIGQAVVVLLTAEDRAGLMLELAEGDDEDVALRGQPRQNVILEAGLAMGLDRSRTILVEVGRIRRASDFEGLNVVRLSNAPATRSALRSRLRSAGCAVNESASDWLRPEVAGDFESSVIPWS